MKCVLLHGLGQTPASWEDTTRAMGEGFDILCPDCRRWIHEDGPAYESLYAALEQACRELEEPICLCGLSLGGVLALQYAIEHPERVHALALIAAQYKMPVKLLQLQNLLFRLAPAASFRRQMGLSKDEVIRLTRSMMALHFEQELEKVRCRTLVLCGSRDRVNRRASVRLAEGIQNAQLCLLPNAGHEAQLDNPGQLGLVLARFFAG